MVVDELSVCDQHLPAYTSRVDQCNVWIGPDSSSQQVVRKSEVKDTMPRGIRAAPEKRYPLQTSYYWIVFVQACPSA